MRRPTVIYGTCFLRVANRAELVLLNRIMLSVEPTRIERRDTGPHRDRGKHRAICVDPL